MKNFRYISTLVLILLLSACGNTPIRDDINWTHTEHDQINFYLDDEACLKQVNSTLFDTVVISGFWFWLDALKLLFVLVLE